jgi:hypothetical protein
MFPVASPAAHTLWFAFPGYESQLTHELHAAGLMIDLYRLGHRWESFPDCHAFGF